MMRMSVDFPEPFGPTSATKLPASTVRSTFSRTGCDAYAKSIPSAATTAMALSSARGSVVAAAVCSGMRVILRFKDAEALPPRRGGDPCGGDARRRVWIERYRAWARRRADPRRRLLLSDRRGGQAGRWLGRVGGEPHAGRRRAA